MYDQKKLRTAATRLARRANLAAQLLNIPRQLRHTTKTARKAIQQALMEFTIRGGKLVIHPEPLLARPHEPGFPEIREMPRHLRLRQVQHANNIAYAQLAAAKQVKDAQA